MSAPKKVPGRRKAKPSKAPVRRKAKKATKKATVKRGASARPKKAAAARKAIEVPRAALTDDPFVSIDEEGIGRLMRAGAEGGRRTRPGLEVGICGEHGGDPKSIRFCAELGFDYVSCSPFRVPVARLAAAQAALEMGKRR